MLQALESHDAVAIAGAPPHSKYDQALYSALRTMLRECLFTKNPGLKKHHIDRVYAWFKEKISISGSSGKERDMKEVCGGAFPLYHVIDAFLLEV